MTAGRALLLAGAFATLGACASLPASDPVPAAPGGGGPRAERPTYALGARWVLDDGVYELIRIDGDLYVFAAGDEARREILLTRDMALAAIQDRDGVDLKFDPPPRLAWPIAIGQQGRASGRFIGYGPRRGLPAKFRWTVAAFEDVRVPAGTLGAFRIDLHVEAEREVWTRRQTLFPATETATWTYRFWYAPEVERIVRSEGARATFAVVALDRQVPASLEVALTAPADQARVGSVEILLSGTVKGGGAVTRLSVTRNGEEVPLPTPLTGRAAEVALSLPVGLRAGRNVLLVTATDAAGATRQEARTVFFDPPRPAEVPRVVETPPSPAVAARPAPEPGVAPPASPAPLEVTVTQPRDQARLEQESTALAGVATAGTGIRRVVVSLNGLEVSRLEEPAPKRSVAVNLPLTLRDGQNTVVVTATDADGRAQQEVRTVHYARPAPLSVDFRYPADGATVRQPGSVVAAVVTSSRGVARVSVTVNGSEVHQQSERASPRSVLVAVPIALRDGVNVIALSVSEPDGTARQEIRTVTLERPAVTAAVAAPAPPAGAPAPNRWAVVIGVSGYDHPDITRLRYTVPDAEAVFQVLTGPGGFKREHVLLLTDTSERKPTYRNIKWALGTFLARSARKDDTVVVFFAGHGAPEIDQRGLERDGLAKYLVPSDADPEDLYSTALPMDELQTIFGRIEAERVVMFLDACYSGAAGGRTFASRKTRATSVDDLFLERLTRARGRAIITASRPAEVSIELPELGHGVFTYYLVQGLKGAADANRDRIVSLQELYEYLERHVSQKSREVGGNQHPVMKGELEGVLPLVQIK